LEFGKVVRLGREDKPGIKKERKLTTITGLKHFGETTTSPYPRYDVNADGLVDILDLRMVAGGM